MQKYEVVDTEAIKQVVAQAVLEAAKALLSGLIGEGRQNRDTEQIGATEATRHRTESSLR